MNEIALNSGVYQVNVDIDPIQLDTPHIVNHGSFAFDTDNSRIVRIPVDWEYDPTQDRIFVLLSNPSTAIKDRIVEYDRETHISRVVFEFDNDIRVYRIARLSSTVYYILSTQKGSTNRNGSIHKYNNNNKHA